jgi:hypothetical protein
MGLSHIQDLRPRDSGCRLAPLTCGSHDLESRFLAERDRRCAADPGHRFVNGVRAPEFRPHASMPTGMADRTLTARPGAYRSYERWLPRTHEVPRSERTERLTHRAGSPMGFDDRHKVGRHRCLRLRSDSSLARHGQWPIQVRVTTANAGCVNTRNLNPNRRRPGVKAVPARTPTGSLTSLPPGDGLC